MNSESKKTTREESQTAPEMSLYHNSGWNVAAASIEPLHNLTVAAAEVILTIDLPYVNQKEVKLSFPANDVVEIYAVTNRKITFKDLGVKHRHGEFTCYHARIRIPVPIDENRIKMHFKSGVLEVHLSRLK